jgi:hypothetical protein
MSQESVEIVRRAQPASGVNLVERYRGSGLPTDIDPTLYAPAFEVQLISKYGPLRPPAHGLEGLARAWREWLEPWQSFSVEIEGLVDAGDDVVTLARTRGYTDPDGAPC